VELTELKNAGFANRGVTWTVVGVCMLPSTAAIQREKLQENTYVMLFS
jgi:hypothetical protein